jgi:hypothetical protein
MFNQRQHQQPQPRQPRPSPPPGAGRHDDFDLVIVLACTLASFISGFAALWSLRLSDGALLVLFGFVGFISAMIGLAHLGYFYGWWHKPVQMQRRSSGSYVQPRNLQPGAQGQAQAQPRTSGADRAVPLEGDDLEHATKLDQFLRGVVEGGHTNQTYWTDDKKWTVQLYNDYIRLFIGLGIVRSNGQGARKELLINDVEDAWRIVNQFHNYDVRKSLELSRRITARGQQIEFDPLPYRE